MLINLPQFNNAATRENVRRAAALSEKSLLSELVPIAKLSPVMEAAVWQEAHDLVEQIRVKQRGQGGIDALLQEFSLSSEEGVALMCLAEALLRIPDEDTQDRMINDRLSGGDWSSHLGHSDSLFVNASAWGLLLTGRVTRLSTGRGVNLLGRSISRLGEPVIRTAMRYAMEIMGSQFVMGETIEDALDRARGFEKRGYTYSYDMLGEGARTMEDADRHYERYLAAIESISHAAKKGSPSPEISIKLSALHPRYELKQHRRVMDEVAGRLLDLARAAASVDVPLTVDAEEYRRLDLSLEVVEHVFNHPDLKDYSGFGMAVQAYLKSGYAVVQWATDLAQQSGRRLGIRLVKGAYWDAEIKWAQERGFDGYPVFSEKCATDLSYQACARHLMQHRQWVYPQFATHNAYTLATVRAFEQESGEEGGYEFQRLHGMGEELYDDLVKAGTACRIYAPVGEHEDLLAYLVRRLLENGANTSFVNNIQNRHIPISRLLEDPVHQVERIRYGIPLPPDIYLPHRENSEGINLDELTVLETLSETMPAVNPGDAAAWTITNPANPDEVVGYLTPDTPEEMQQKLGQVSDGAAGWASLDVSHRAECLLQFADRLEAAHAGYLALCMKEAGKTLDDAVAEIREAVDFCRYYAREAELLENEPLGTVLCISPWNFPLAIFTGQVTAALVSGNTVLAKPAEQTSLIAQKAVADLHACGVPESVLQLIVSEGPPVSEHLVTDTRVDAVMFTGSDEAARAIAGTLSARARAPVHLTAETGGQNAMIVDSTALAEQVVDDVIVSAFLSAGQRCSAMRLLYLQADVADEMIEKIIGKMKELSVGDPASLETDVGPVIDEAALKRLQQHVDRLKNTDARILHQCETPSSGHFFAPTLIEIPDISLLTGEVFGPVLHIRRYRSGDLEAVVDEIDATGFGLTMGVHSRIESRFDRIAELSRCGNVYVNRNMVGAIVGVQPFGGRGLSGTGPKAGGPDYLQALTRHVLPEPVETGMTLPAAGTAAQPEPAVAREWLETPVLDRIRQVRMLLLETLKANPGFDANQVLADFSVACDWFTDRDEMNGRPCTRLPSPTGETDDLVLEALGVVNVIACEASEAELLMACVALLAGNCVLVSGRHWKPAGDLPATMRYTETLDLSADALALWRDPSIYTELYQVHLQQQKALPKIIFGTHNPLVYQWEKTISINTTAAGGNASLMAGSR